MILLGVVFAFMMVIIGFAWVELAGYEGYLNANREAGLRQANNDAAVMLNHGDLRDALPRLTYVLQNAANGTPLAGSARHNLGVYWLEVGRDAQQRGDLLAAQDDYSKAMNLLPERQDEISRSLQSIRLALSGPNGAAFGRTPIDLSVRGQGTAGGPNSMQLNPVSLDQLPRNPGYDSGTDSPYSKIPRADDPASIPGSGQDDSLPRSRGEYQAGLQAEARGDREEAVKHFDASIILAPGSPWAGDAQKHFNDITASAGDRSQSPELPAIPENQDQ